MTDATDTTEKTGRTAGTPEAGAPGSGPGGNGGSGAVHKPRGRARSALRRVPVWCAVPAAGLVGALAGTAYGIVSPPEYTATSYVVVVPEHGADPADANGFATAYGRVAQQVAVLADAQVWAGVPAATLKEHVTTSTSPDAPMISVTARSSRPATARDMADGVARALVSNGGHLQADTDVRVLQFSRAVRPTAPSSPSTPLSGLVGACGGGLLGGLGLLVRPRRAQGPFGTVPGPASALPSVATRPETV